VTPEALTRPSPWKGEGGGKGKEGGKAEGAERERETERERGRKCDAALAPSPFQGEGWVRASSPAESQWVPSSRRSVAYVRVSFCITAW